MATVNFTLLPPKRLNDPGEILQWQCDEDGIEPFQSEEAMLAHAMKVHKTKDISFTDQGMLPHYGEKKE